MTTETPRKLGWKTRLALIGFGLVLSLALIEGGLRLAGAVLLEESTVEYLPTESSYLTELRYKRDETYEVYADGAQEAPKRMVVIGDSFANGGNAFSNQTYPYYLHRYFEEAGENVSVLNMGKCEDSTFGVEKRLTRYLEELPPRERPALVAFIIGSADKYNLSTHASPEHFPTVDVDWHDIAPAWYQDLRLYKLYRHLSIGLSSRSIVADYQPREEASEEAFNTLAGFYERFRANAKAHGWRHGEDSLGMPAAFDEENARIIADYAQMAPRYFSAVNVVELNFVEELLNAIVIGWVVLYASKTRHADAIGVLLQLERDFPIAFWTGAHLHYARYNLFQLFQLQSKYTAENVLPQMDKTLAAHPELGRESRFVQFRETLVNGDRVDAVVDEKRMASWANMVALCQSKGIRMLLLNYPSDYRSANRIIEAVSKLRELSPLYEMVQEGIDLSSIDWQGH